MFKCIECGKVYTEEVDECECGGLVLNYFEFYMEDEDEYSNDNWENN